MAVFGGTCRYRRARPHLVASVAEARQCSHACGAALLPRPQAGGVALELASVPRAAGLLVLQVVQRMMGAFEGRCAQVYGPSSLHRRPGPAQHVAAGGR